MIVSELIEKKRDNKELSKPEIDYLIENYTNGNIPDYQMAAFNMAVFFNGMTVAEKSAFTQAMLHSGEVMDFSDLKQYCIDKHSTGGVGDKVSLILTPIVASLGILVPMIGGRGLGHTGGTLDKLEAIPNFKIDIPLMEFKENIKRVGANIIGQTKEIAPADKKLYALRDVTATVPSIPLITGSIMSKKLAEGINGLVLDVKFGSGAFMKTIPDAIELAESLVLTGEHSSVDVIAFLTDMSQTLGYKIGNWLEVEEVIDCLHNSGPKDLMQVTHLLAGTMIFMAGKAKSIEAGIDRSIEQIKNGEAFEKFIEILESQSADTSVIKDPKKYQKQSITVDVFSERSGFLAKVNCSELGMIAVEMGGGRQKTSDIIDPDVGIEIYHKIADKIQKGDRIARLYLKKDDEEEKYIERFRNAIELSSEQPEQPRIAIKKVTKDGVSELKELFVQLEKIEASN